MPKSEDVLPEIDPELVSRHMLELMTRSQALMQDFLSRQSAQKGTHMDPKHVTDAFMQLGTHLLNNPQKLAETQLSFWQDYMKLWQSAALRAMGEPAAPVIEAPKTDRRFKNPEWRENQAFNFLKQSYLLYAKHLNQTVAELEGLSDKERAKIDFYARQYVDALSPSNFAFTNPDVIKATMEEKGENLLRGYQQILDDIERGKGALVPRMTDLEAFEVGRNIAVTPGKVVFRNRMFELIQYSPTTEQVYETPLLIIPPWINKFYILDLTQEKSFIRWAVEQGYTVFCMSWKNPDERYADTSFEDYMLEGALAAMDAVKAATGQDECHVIGYCIAGTLLAATLAYLAAKGDAARVKSATFFTAQVDFSEAGELQVFIDEEQVAAIDRMMADKGYLDAATMSTTFNMLRSNDLVWSFVVNNYLLGKEPMPFDLLYWNADATRLPRAMHNFYLKNMYQENNLIKPGALVLDGQPIDLKSVKTPVYIQAGKDDHIAPFRSVYKLLKAFSGPRAFMLAGSGHIAGVINPPAAKKYQYWTNDKKPATPEEWLSGAEEHPGSWWPHWHAWLSKKSGKKTPARKPGDGQLKVIEDAPGTYVRERSF